MVMRLESLRVLASLESLPNNSLNPTRLSLAFIKLVWWDLCCVVASAVGLIRALGVWLNSDV